MVDCTASDFGEDFHWGVSTAAYQIEGAYDKDGKSPSIWDHFTTKKGKIHNNSNANIACDFYHRYSDDTALIRHLCIPNHRFSISWSRILPEGTGRINRKGIDYYDRLIDRTLELGIISWVTLYHWDLPQCLQKEGGWVNRDIIYWFSYFTETCLKYFGDRVKNWIILNEPMVFTGAGYFLGVHAPGKKGIRNFLRSTHHAALCQSIGGSIIRKFNAQNKVGTTISCSYIEPFSESKKDRQAAIRTDALLNRMFVEPLLGLGYPVNELPVLKRIEQYMKPGDAALLAFDMDFIGIQNYTREIVKYNQWIPFVQAKIINAAKRNVPTTLMNWEVHPPAIYQLLKKFAAYPHMPQMIVTENGAAFKDTNIDGRICDDKRIDYLKAYIGQVLKAKQEGVDVNGYFVWTMFDNFEWAEGYVPTFGLVSVNFKTQERIIKDSGFWYRDFLNS